MKNIKLFQIYYDEDTKRSLDRDFLPLDNMKNSRPDWREYWPIRNYLLGHDLKENEYYGFFSPKFKSKTGLAAKDCFDFVNSQSDEVDVFSFSPFFDQGAFFQNSFYQSISQHPNSRLSVEAALEILTPAVNIGEIVMHSGNNIFCNFFIAKSEFWKVWLKKCELLWVASEANIDPIVQQWSRAADFHDSPAPIKTFLIERVASLILATNPKWKTAVYDPFKLPLSTARISQEKSALIQMDALKIAYADQGRQEYLNLFHGMAELVLKRLG